MLKKAKSLVWLLILAMFVSLFPSIASAAGGAVDVTIHYHRFDGNYDSWNVWTWVGAGAGKAVDLTGDDEFGKFAKYTMDNTANDTTVGFILRKGQWVEREGAGNRFANIKDGKAEVWIVEGVDTVFESGADAQKALIPTVKGALMTSFNKIQITVNIPVNLTKLMNGGIKINSKNGPLEMTSITNPNAKTCDVLGYETNGDKIHFVLVPGKFDVPSIDASGSSRIYIAGTMNNWNGNGADGWLMTWNSDKKYYELTKTIGTDVNFGNEFKFINIADGKTNWMNGNNIRIIDQSITSSILVTTKEKLSVDQTYKVTVADYTGEPAAVAGGSVFASKEFNDRYFYTGNDLGYTYAKKSTTFRVWAPLAEKVVLMTYKNGDIASSDKGTAYDMKKSTKGTWTITLKGNLNGIFYTYKVTNYGTETESADPYARGCGINGDRSAVVDLSTTNPKGWSKDTKPAFSKVQDAVIYEMQIRDLAMDKDSGIKNKGKYLEFTENGTKGPNGVTTGIDHLKELGVTHVHILPTYDFATIDEKTLDKNVYNWGYDPKNYNVPEGSFSTDPSKPTVRINEYKQMVAALHKNGIRVIFDAVYNHTRENVNSWFNKIVPGYYYRMRDDGTFYDGSNCGNETASERSMCRKYIIDSVKYWVNEYHIDGFRFDLMGIHDAETMRLVREEMNKIDPSIVIFGEGWDLGNLARDQRCIQPLASKVPGVGFFNDNIRDNLKGPWNNATGHGYVDGAPNMELEVMEGVVGSVKYNDIVKDYNGSPTQSMNYVANHDNNTLYDKLLAANPKASKEDLTAMHKLSNAIVFTLQGVSYLAEGEDFLRTKGGDSNSFVSPDSVNALDWSEKAANIDVFNYYKGLIKLRKTHPAFRMSSTKDVQNHISFISSPQNTVAYVIKDNANKDCWKNILVAYNANKEAVIIDIPDASWNKVLDGQKAGVNTIEKVSGSKLTVAPYSAVVMYTNEKIKVNDLFAGKSIVKTQVNSKDLTTPNGKVTASENVTLKDNKIYLPLAELMGTMSKAYEYSGSNGTFYIKDKKTGKQITINVTGDKIEVDGKAISNGELILINNNLMVSRDFIESMLNAKVFADFRRYNEDTQRADNNSPDIYVIY